MLNDLHIPMDITKQEILALGTEHPEACIKCQARERPCSYAKTCSSQQREFDKSGRAGLLDHDEPAELKPLPPATSQKLC